MYNTDKTILIRNYLVIADHLKNLDLLTGFYALSIHDATGSTIIKQ